MRMFEQNPHPTWIYDHETLRILAVNDAAVRRYGYSRDEFLALTAADLYPSGAFPEGLDAELREGRGAGPGGSRRHRAKDGSILHVELIRHTMSYAGRRAHVVLAHDVTGRFQAVTDLDDSRTRLQLALEAARLTLWEFDLMTRQVRWPQGVATSYGLEEGSFKGTEAAFWDLVHPEDRERMQTAVSEAVSGSGHFDEEFRSIRPDGGIEWHAGVGRVVRDPSGRPLRLVGVGSNITARKRVEEALRESEEMFRNISGAIPLPMAITRLADSRILYANAPFLSFFGYTPEDVTRRTVMDFLGDDDSRLAIRESLLRGGGVDRQLRVRRVDGTFVWVNVSMRRMLFRGEPAVIGVAFDDTQRKRAEEALVAAEAKFRSLVEQSLVGTYIIQDGRLQYVNPRLAEIFGVAPREMLAAASFLDFVDAADRSQVEEHLRRQLAGETEPARHDFRGRRPDGTPVSLEAHGTRTEFNGRFAVIGILLDVTESKRAEETLHFRLGFERLIAAISAQFINLPRERIDEGIQGALRSVGEFAGADRSYVFERSPDGRVVDNTHEWCAPGIPPSRPGLQGVSIAQYPWLAERILRREVVHIPRVGDLPPEASAERERFLVDGPDWSVLLVPMIARGEVTGLLGFDKLREMKRWSEDTVALLDFVGQIIGNALDRKRSDEVLRYRLEFETLISVLSAEFINLPIEQVDDGVRRALRQVGEFVRVDRCYVFRLDPDGGTLDNTHEWCAPGVASYLDQLQRIPASRFPWLLDRLRRFETVHVPRVADLPDAAQAEREEFERESIRSLLLVPLRYGDRLAGFLGCDAVRAETSWTEDTVALLSLVGQTLVNAFERKRAEEAIRVSTRRLEQAHQQLQENQAQLVQSEKMAGLGLLAAGVAHEINNPVGFVMSNIGTLGDYVGIFKDLLEAYEALAAAETDGGREAARARIEAIRSREDLAYILKDIDALLRESQEGANRVREIVQALRSFARADEGERVEIDVNAGLEATIKVVWNEIKYKCRLAKRLAPVPPVSGYPGQLNQVFLNLILNAAQAVPEKGEIAVETAVEDGCVVVRISDNGVGIPPENRSKLFTPFFTTKPVGKGTGLGLSISYNIVRKHQGTIEVRSEPGQGSTFTVRLPVAGDPHA